MKTRIPVGIAFALLAVGAVAMAGEAGKTVTVSGKIACAKCTLGVEGAKDCQNVLVVENEQGGKPTYYYLVKNDVTEAYGHVCQGEKAAVVSGTVRQSDGKTWLTATKMEPPEKA